ncbi:hypothetical protein [Embleya sp. NPDC005575]|uniref:hypothetical protein n=1 Tax=Embleya sp. NPDC005575 TaxID=3156892 RepID=UPI0033AB6783
MSSTALVPRLVSQDVSRSRLDDLAFWSAGRDNDSCPGGGVSPTCSGISQSPYEFTNLFENFTG